MESPGPNRLRTVGREDPEPAPAVDSVSIEVRLVHGSAPDIAGRGIANPIAIIWSGALMLDFLGEAEAAELMINAIKSVTAEGRILPREVGGSATTVEIGDEIVAKMRAAA